MISLFASFVLFLQLLLLLRVDPLPRNDLSLESTRFVKIYSEKVKGTILFHQIDLLSNTSYIFSPSQLQALSNLYNATNGENWRWQENAAVYGVKWNFDTTNPNPCSSRWQGITCSYGTTCSKTKPCNIISLSLPSYNLVGYLPESIRNLTYLQTLNLNSNQLQGTIPSSIGLISNLSSLNLSINHLDGPIPTSIGKLSRLSQLSLSQNRLTGSLPSFLFSDNLNLQTLELGYNDFRSSIPVEVQQLTKLLVLNLSENFLTGTIPAELSRSLQRLALNGNLLNGSIPSQLSSLVALTDLDLGANRLAGSLPANVLSSLRSLESLDLSSNFLGSSLPDNFSSLKNLTTLYLDDNLFTGSLPPSLLGCRRLVELELGRNKLAGRLPSNWTALQSLQLLSLETNFFSDELPESLYDLVSLRYLFLAENELVGSLSPRIERLRNLWQLDLSTNRLNGSLPDSLGNLPALYLIMLDTNLFTGTIPARLSNYSFVTEIDLHENFLTGSLPAQLTVAYPLLQLLSLSVNHLNGTIPADLFSQGISLSYFSADFNHLTGSLPDQFHAPNSFRFVYLSHNELNGSIPQNIQELSLLSRFDLSVNRLTGSIPEGYYHLPLVTALLHDNFLRGTLSANVSRLQLLLRLELDSNLLSGTIPPGIASLPLLQQVSLANNSFFGPFPAMLSNASSLQTIYLQDNLFTRSIPADFFMSLPQLVYFRVSYNSLTGPLPQIISDRPAGSLWEIFDVAWNQLASTIPENLCEQQAMKVLILSGNLFSGPLPADLLSLPGLAQLDVSSNLLRGPLPTSLANATLMQNLTLSSNFLSSTIPDVFSALHLLAELYLDENLFTGSFPSSMLQLKELELLYLAANQLVGTIPEAFSELRKLSTINFSANSFSGSAGNIFNSFEHLEILILSSNLFEGPLDSLLNSSLQQLLNTVDISSNRFSGTVPASFFAPANRSAAASSNNLLSFAAVKNCLTGSIPPQICQSLHLTALALDGLHTSEACITKILPLSKSKSYLIPRSLQGTIPPCLYQMQKLQVLHLSGNGLTGSLPSDGLSSSLTDLSLSHNLLTGTIPRLFQEAVWSNFDLSFNKLTGVLSQNISNFQRIANASLALDVNRLSGVIPSQLLAVQDINILKGNIFQCSDQLSPQQSLPRHDPDVASYTCGSDSVDVTLYVWLVVLSSLLLLTAVAWLSLSAKASQLAAWLRLLEEWRENLADWWAVYRDHSAPPLSFHGPEGSVLSAPSDHVKDFGEVMSGIRQLCLSCCLFILLVVLPVHVALGAFYSTYSYQYAWVLSIAFLSGKVPAVVLLLFLTGFLLYIQAHLPFLLEREEKERKRKSFVSSLRRNVSAGLLLTMGGLTLLNCLVVLVVQFSYVLALTNGQDRGVLVVTAMAVAGFTVFWNNVVLIDGFSVVLRHVQSKQRRRSLLAPSSSASPRSEPAERFPPDSIAEGPPQSQAEEAEEGEQGEVPSIVENPLQGRAMPSSSSSSSSLREINAENDLFDEERRIFFLTHLLLFNNVLAPLAASAFVSVDCFYYVVVTPPAVHTEYNVLLCTQFISSLLVEGDCLAYQSFSQSVSYVPPFFYSFQCSSSLLTSFAYVYLTRYLYIGVVLPLFRLSLKYLQEWLFWHRPAGRRDWLFAAASWALYAPLRVLAPRGELERKRQRRSPSRRPDDDDVSRQTEMVAVGAAPAVVEDVEAADPPSEPASKAGDEVLAANEQFLRSAKRIVNRDYVVLPILSEFAVFITFGAIFPPLAVAVCFTIGLSSALLQLAVGRLFSVARTQRPLVAHLRRVNEECRNFRRLFLQAIPSVSLLAAFFWGFFLFDILGDQLGSAAASLWIFLAMGLSPLLIRLSQQALRSLPRSPPSTSSSSSPEPTGPEKLTEIEGEGSG